jgi:hypothetical protein
MSDYYELINLKTMGYTNKLIKEHLGKEDKINPIKTKLYLKQRVDEVSIKIKHKLLTVLKQRKNKIPRTPREEKKQAQGLLKIINNLKITVFIKTGRNIGSEHLKDRVLNRIAEEYPDLKEAALKQISTTRNT